MKWRPVTINFGIGVDLARSNKALNYGVMAILGGVVKWRVAVGVLRIGIDLASGEKGFNCRANSEICCHVKWCHFVFGILDYSLNDRTIVSQQVMPEFPFQSSLPAPETE